MTNPPFIISLKLILERIFIANATTTVVNTKAIENRVNLTILPSDMSGILFIIIPAIVTVVAHPIIIRAALTTSFVFIFFIAFTTNLIEYAKTTNKREIPTEVKNWKNPITLTFERKNDEAIMAMDSAVNITGIATAARPT